LDNARVALRWAISVDDPELALRLAARGVGEPLFSINPSEGLRLLAPLVDGPREPTNPWIHAEALRVAGALATEAGDHHVAVRYLWQSVAEWRKADNERSTAAALMALARATLALAPEEMAEPRTLLQEALEIYERLSDKWGMCQALHNLGELERHAGDRAKATSLLERALAVCERVLYRAPILHGLGDVALDNRDFERAASCYRESLATIRHWRDERDTAYCLAGLSAVAAATRKAKRAGRLVGAVERIELHRRAGVWLTDARYRRFIDAAPIAAEDVEAGRVMTLDEAVDYALEATD
jgi:tetratricopeptide (TPR) repeat protein